MLTRLTSSGATTTPSSPKALQRFQSCIAFLWPSIHGQAAQRKSTQLDAIDCFTNELVNRKTRKWEEFRENIVKKKDVNVEVLDPASSATTHLATATFTQSVEFLTKGVMNGINNVLRSPQLGLDIRQLSQAQLDNLLLSTLEIKNKVDFLYLIRQCIRWEQLPSSEVLIACLKYLSTLCRIQYIESLSDICRSHEHPLAKMHPNLAPFKAMALWRSGGTELALSTLQRGYDETTTADEGRRLLRIAFRTIAEETLAQKSEAVLVSLMDVATSIYVRHKDIFIIACIWKQCFISDWFCDQKTAAELFDNYKELQQLVAKKSNSLCTSFLRCYNVDAVHRLIEVFLQYKEKDACSNCLGLLFNYQYYRKDLRACAEIVKSCSELEMPLTEIQNEQFLSLFINQTEPTKSTIRKVNQQFKEFQYKF